MHTYRALAFTPKKSIVVTTYSKAHYMENLVVRSGISEEWPSHRTLTGHISSVVHVAFSPDGTRIVSGSYDKTLRLWDGTTGASIGEPMEGHTDKVSCIAFSPDGT